MKERRGFALVAALWLLVALSAIGMEISLAARRRRLATTNALDIARARAAAAAGIAHARSRVDETLRRAADDASRSTRSGRTPGVDPLARTDGLLPDSVAIGAAWYRVSIVDAGARLNLNLATEEELRRLFIALYIDAGESDRLAQAISDWRDADDLRHARGAERADYLDAGARALPRNGPFEMVGELLDVREMTAARFATVRPYFTLVGTGQIDLATADRAVLLAMPGMTEEAAAVIVRSRSSMDGTISLDALEQRLSPGARAALVPELPRIRARTVSAPRELEVRSEGWVAGAPARAAERALFVRTATGTMVVGRRSER